MASQTSIDMHSKASKLRIEFLSGELRFIDLYSVMQNEQAHNTSTQPIKGSSKEIINTANVNKIEKEAIF